MPVRLLKDVVDTSQPQTEGAGSTISATTEIFLEECTVPPPGNCLSVETESEPDGGDINHDGATHVGEGSSPPSPPTPPWPCLAYEACNIVTDDIKGVDTEVYYSDVEPKDEDDGNSDAKMLGEYPVDDLKDEINLTSIPSNEVDPSNHEAGVNLDLTISQVSVRDDTQEAENVLSQTGKMRKRLTKLLRQPLIMVQVRFVKRLMFKASTCNAS